jgi:hypothetical protein
MVCFIFGAVLMVWYVLILELFSWYGMLINISKQNKYHTS